MSVFFLPPTFFCLCSLEHFRYDSLVGRWWCFFCIVFFLVCFCFQWRVLVEKLSVPNFFLSNSFYILIIKMHILFSRLTKKTTQNTTKINCEFFFFFFHFWWKRVIIIWNLTGGKIIYASILQDFYFPTRKNGNQKRNLKFAGQNRNEKQMKMKMKNTFKSDELRIYCSWPTKHKIAISKRVAVWEEV